MKKIIVTSLFIAICSLCGKLYAQSYETSAEMKTGYQNAVAIDLGYSDDEARAALKSRFAAKGLNGKNASKGFTEYKNVKFSDFGPTTMSIYTKVVAKDKKAKESKVYVLVSLIEGEFCSSSTCATVIDNVKKFLDSLEPHVSLYSTGVQIDQQNDVIRKTEKDLSNLQDKARKLENERQKLLEEIATNKTNIENKAKEVEMNKQVLEELSHKKSTQSAVLPQ